MVRFPAAFPPTDDAHLGAVHPNHGTARIALTGIFAALAGFAGTHHDFGIKQARIRRGAVVFGNRQNVDFVQGVFQAKAVGTRQTKAHDGQSIVGPGILRIGVEDDGFQSRRDRRPFWRCLAGGGRTSSTTGINGINNLSNHILYRNITI